MCALANDVYGVPLITAVCTGISPNVIFQLQFTIDIEIETFTAYTITHVA